MKHKFYAVKFKENHFSTSPEFWAIVKGNEKTLTKLTVFVHDQTVWYCNDCGFIYYDKRASLEFGNLYDAIRYVGNVYRNSRIIVFDQGKWRENIKDALKGLK